LVLLASLAIIAMAMAVEAGSPPSSGDWTIGDSTAIDTGETIIQGNITVLTGGHLSLSNHTLVMQGIEDGDVGIYVNNGAQLSLYNTSVLSWKNDIHYWFYVWGTASIIDCDISNVASNDERWDRWDNIRGGVQIYGPNTILINSKFHDNQRINVFVSGVSPKIERCEFYNSEYVTTQQVYAYSPFLGRFYYTWYTDATGLYLNWAKPTITGCRFYNNGIATSTLQFYNALYPDNLVISLGRGLLAYESSPTIIETEFWRNGQHGGDRLVDGTNQTFYSTPFEDDPVKGGLACVGGSARPVIETSTFDQNQAFGISGFLNGFPSLVENCELTENTRLQGGNMLLPSAAIYVKGEQGNITIANTTTSQNLVAANIWIDGPDLLLMNYTNNLNLVVNMVNVLLMKGDHRIENSNLEGDPNLAANVRIEYGTPQPRLTILNSNLKGGRDGIHVNTPFGAYISLEDSTISGVSEMTFRLMYSNVSCLNCTFDDLTMKNEGYEGDSTVVIQQYFSLHASWQNGAAVEGAQVFIHTYRGWTFVNGITDAGGNMDPIIVETQRYNVARTIIDITKRTPINVTVIKGEAIVVRTAIDFDKTLHVEVTLNDPEPPFVIITSPMDGSAHTILDVRWAGFAMDNASGMDRIIGSYDGNEWFSLGTSEWSINVPRPEGLHQLWVRAFDIAGNIAVAKVTLWIDITPPLIEIEEPSVQPFYTKYNSFVLRGRTEIQAEILLNNVIMIANINGSFETVVGPLIEGRSNHYITVEDMVGLTNEIVIVVIKDSKPPMIVIEEPPELTSKVSIQLTGFISEVNPRSITINGDQVNAGNINYRIKLLEGNNTIVVHAVDRAGNSASQEFTVKRDTIPPQVEIVFPPRDLIVNTTTIVIRGTVKDEISVIRLETIKIPVVDGAFQYEVDLDGGYNTFTMSSVDEAGNLWTRTISVMVDLEPPFIEVKQPLDWSYTDRHFVNVTGRAIGAKTVWVAGIEIIEDRSVFDVAVSLVETPPGGQPNRIVVEAIDAAGNRARHTVHVYMDTRPPGLKLDKAPETTREGYLTISGRSGSLDEVISIYVNGAEVPRSQNGSFQIVLPLDIGENYFVVTATDPAGNEAIEAFTVDRLRRPTRETGSGIPIWLVVVLAASIVAVLLLLAQHMGSKEVED
jgi:hypothetical protein